jgi:hypothetical protein
MEIKEVKITPEMAKKMIEKSSIRNRRTKERSVNAYAHDMSENKWKENTGELIKMSSDGSIIDGHHRLLAVIISGKTIKFHVAYNLSEDVFSVIDTGVSRTSNDTLFICGYRNANLLGSSIGLYLRIKNNLYASSQPIANYEILQEYESNIEKWDQIIHKTVSWYEANSKVISATMIGGFYSAISESDPVMADLFMDYLCKDKGDKITPAYVLRKRLIENKISSGKLTRITIIVFMIKAWNAYRDGRTISYLKFDPKSEAYPTIE